MTALLPRQLLFGNPERAGGVVSPDGRWLGFLAPVDGVLNVWIARTETPAESRPITRDRARGIRSFSFAYTGNHLLYAQDVDGDENFRIFVVDLQSGEERALSPQGSRAMLGAASPDFPTEIVIVVNDRDPRFFDPVRVDLLTGASTRLLENDAFLGFVFDSRYRPVYAQQQSDDGGDLWFAREGDGWKPWMTVPQTDGLTTGLLGLTADDRTAYLTDSRDRDTGALFAVDLETGHRTLVHEDPRADVTEVLTHPRTHRVQAVRVTWLRSEWTVIDPDVARDLERLPALVGGAEIDVASRTLADDLWIVTARRSDATTTTWIYDRAAGTATHWFDMRPSLVGAPLVPMHEVAIRSRDGLVLPSYYSVPAGSGPFPTVLLVHGGPWVRDDWGISPEHQWLANRGYAVLSVNYRGSTGFGKAFVNAGDGEWAGKMHDDLLDAVEWAVEKGIARRDKVAIMGGSYGGYATLVGLTFTPEVFACGVDIVGPSSLVTMLGSIPPYWAPAKRQLISRVGDDGTDEGRAFLASRSPLTHVERIVRPLLIGQGANDPRVKQAEADQIVAAMEAKGIPVTYALFPDEGHGFARPENRLAFYAVAEEFLGRVLGGRVEPVGSDLEGSTITIPAGLELVPGLAAAIA